MTIRPERTDDNAAILRLTYKAFLTLDYPGRRRMDEHYLIHLLQRSDYIISELCFVAEPEKENIASNRMLEACGFAPSDAGYHYRFDTPEKAV